MKRDFCSKKIFNTKRVLSIILAAAFFMSPVCYKENAIVARAGEGVTKKVEIPVSKPVISEVRNDYKGLFISWKESEGAAGYRLFRRLKTKSPWELIADVPADTHEYIDKDAMKEGGIYTYMVQAYNGDKVSEESAPKTITRFPLTKVRLNVKYAQKSARTMQKMINDFRLGSENWVWNATNTQQVRVQGLTKLAYDYNLEKIAMTRAAEVAVKFGHERPNGSDCFSAFSEAGYKYTYAGENIAYGFKTAKKAFEAFKETNEKYAKQGHRRNMLSTNYNVCAIGHAKVNGVHYWVQLFAYTEDDSDYTKTISKVKKTSIYIASDDVSSYKKTLDALGAKLKDYAPGKVTWNDAVADKRKAVLYYNKSIGASGYEIYRSTRKKNGFKKVATIKGQFKLKYTDKKLSRKKKYYYYIVPFRIAHDDKVYGKKSEIKMIKTG